MMRRGEKSSNIRLCLRFSSDWNVKFEMKRMIWRLTEQDSGDTGGSFL
jgi:hypothetical protein